MPTFDSSWAVALGPKDLPVLPDVTERVLRLASDERCSLASLAEVLSRDAAITAHVLRLANSPLYRGREPIVSLLQAASRLGTKKLRDVAVLVASESRLFQARGFEVEARRAFSHGLLTGLWAQEVARRLRGPVEESFLCGLLHDVGVPVLLQVAADHFPQVASLRAEVTRVVDDRHADVGAGLIRAWLLPERLADAVSSHHGAPSDQLGSILVLADLIAELVADDLDNEAVNAAILDAPVSATLNLYDDDVEAIIRLRDAVLGTFAAMSGAS